MDERSTILKAGIVPQVSATIDQQSLTGKCHIWRLGGSEDSEVKQAFLYYAGGMWVFGREEFGGSIKGFPSLVSMYRGPFGGISISLTPKRVGL